MSNIVSEIINTLECLFIILGIIIGVIFIIGLVFAGLLEMGLRNKFGVYDPLYKCWFDYSLLNEEQNSRFIPGSDRLADPPKGTKRKPFWKEQPTLGKKILTFVFMGNRPRPDGLR